MTNGNTSGLRNFAAIPTAIETFEHAGSEQDQLALNDKAWSMLERHVLPDGFRASRFANAWLGEHDWRLQIVPQRELWKPERVAPLAAAAARRGHAILYGVGLPQNEEDRSEVWRVRSDAEDISRFFESHFAVGHLLFPDDLSFAIHGWIDDLAAVSGPEAFLRQVIAPEDLGMEATSEAVAYMDPSATIADYATLLLPYAPFMMVR